MPSETRIEGNIRKFLLSLIIAVVLFFVYNLDIARIWVVRHRSMLATLKDGDIVFSVSARIRKPQVEDIVIARSLETGNIIKRVASMDLSEDGTQWYYLLGDNPKESFDSRKTGMFPRYALRGVVVWTYRR